MTITNPKLSGRLRPDVEAAPWVLAEIEKLELQLEQTRLKHPIEKMRRCLDLLPPPGGEVVAECLDEIEMLHQQLAESKGELSRARLQNAIVYGTSHPEIYKTVEDEQRQQLAAAQEREQTNDTLLDQQGDKLAALNDLVAELRKQLAELLDWQQKAFAAHPNIDIDIDLLNGGN